MIGVKTVQHLKIGGNVGRRPNMDRKKMWIGEEMFMIPEIIGFILPVKILKFLIEFNLAWKKYKELSFLLRVRSSVSINNL